MISQSRVTAAPTCLFCVHKVTRPRAPLALRMQLKWMGGRGQGKDSVDEAQGRIKNAKTAWNKFPQRRQGVHRTATHLRHPKPQPCAASNDSGASLPSVAANRAEKLTSLAID